MEKQMFSKEYLERVKKNDPILAQMLRSGTAPDHHPVWDQNDLVETRDLSDDEAKKLLDWTMPK